LIGYQLGGFAGALAATATLCTPTCLLTYFVAHVWERFKDAPLRIAIQAGLMPVTVGLVAATAYLIAAKLLLMRARPRDAWMIYERALAVEPRNVDALMGSGLALTLLKRPDEAMEKYRRALEVDPRNADAHHALGLALATSGRESEAIPEFDQAIRNPLYKTPETALINAGRCSLAFGDLNGANNYFRRAQATAPNNPQAIYGVALVTFKLGRAEDALAIGARDAHQAGAHFARARVELDQHAAGKIPRHLLEKLVLAGKMLVDGLLRHPRAARDLVDARAVAAREELAGGGAQHALAVNLGHGEALLFMLQGGNRTRLMSLACPT